MISPGQTEKVVVQVPGGRRRGTLTRKVTVETNDRANPELFLECETKVMAALHAEPQTVSFGQVKRDAPEQKRTITITRGAGPPVKPVVLSTGNAQIGAELREIEPGERYELDVTIRPPWPNRSVRGTVLMETGVEQAPRERISVFANITPRLQVLPQRFMIRSVPEEGLELTARLRWDTQKPGKVLEATVSDPELKARIEEQDGQQKVVLEIPGGYDPQKRAGNSLILKTDDPAVPIVRVPILVVGQPAAAKSRLRTDKAEPPPPVTKPPARAEPSPAAEPATTAE